jgi:hypothetical protein
MKNTLTTSLAILTLILSYPALVSAQGGVKVEPQQRGIVAPLVDQGDYYLHPNGKKIKFLRKKDVFALEMAPLSAKRAKSVGTMARLNAQFGNRVSQLKGHRLGSMNVVRVNNEQASGLFSAKSGKALFDIKPSMLKSIDSDIANIQPVLANEKGLGDILVTTKMLLKLQSAAAVEGVSQRFNLRLTRRLNTSGLVYQFESLGTSLASTDERFALVRRVMSDPLVEWAQPLFKSRPNKASFEPNDTLFDKQWHLRNTGRQGSRCDTDCDANNAWDIGDANGVGAVSGLNTVIAIIDDGVQLNHEDLLIWENTAEVSFINGGTGVDGVDDDGNGFVDDVNGWDFVDDSLSPLLNPAADISFCVAALASAPMSDPIDGSGHKCRCQDTDGTAGPDNDANPQRTTSCLVNSSDAATNPVIAEQDNHGTAVAGLAAAKGNNGLGVAGTAYSAQVLPIRLVSSFDANISDDFCARAVEAMSYAGRHADVINNSWSVDEGTCPALDQVIELVVNGELFEEDDDDEEAASKVAAQIDPLPSVVVPEGATIISKRPNLGSPVIFATGNNASGWVKVTVPVSEGPHAYEWRFLRTFEVAEGVDQLALHDSAWIDDVRFPDGSIEQFESGIPTGDENFTLGCAVSVCDEDCAIVAEDGLDPGEQCLLWGINEDENFSRSGRSATIDHSANLSPCNHSYMSIVKDGPAGEVSFWIWVSTDLQELADKVEFLVDGVEQLSFGDIALKVDNGVAYPASLDIVIAVGASDSGDLSGVSDSNLAAEERAMYSQYGAALDVLAPSSNQHLGIVTTDRYGLGTVGLNSNVNIGGEGETGAYTDAFFGTSASAPTVAGIAAAMIATNTSITAANIEQTLQASADKIGRRGASIYAADENGNTRSDFYGYGRANMFKALQLVLGGSVDEPSELCTPESFSYTSFSDLLLPNFAPDLSGGMCPALGPQAPEAEDGFCFPIRTTSGNTAVICL